MLLTLILTLIFILAVCLLLYGEEEKKEKAVDYLRPDGKTQVTIEYDENRVPVRLDTVVVSTQHAAEASLEQIWKDIVELVIKPVVPTGLLDDRTRCAGS